MDMGGGVIVPVNLGVNSDTLTFGNVQESNEGEYFCTVTDITASVTSATATLTVVNPCGDDEETVIVEGEVPGDAIQEILLRTLSDRVKDFLLKLVLELM